MSANYQLAMENPAENLIEVRNLKKYFPIKGGFLQRTIGQVQAVDDVSFDIRRGKVLGIVGESGCGKSTCGRTILNLLEPTAGTVNFDGNDLTKMDKNSLHDIRRRMQIVFQDPFSSLDPRMTVYDIVGEGLMAYHLSGNRKELRERVEELIEKCGLFKDQALRYPHQFSGGQRQRICIARALAAGPDFVVCDEAVSALDVSIQAQIINLLKDLQSEMGLTYLFISHDLSVVRFISDDVVVMYLGQVVEKGSKNDIFTSPLHPYTEALLSAAPAFTPAEKKTKKRIILEGDLPSPSNPPPGCRFAERCRFATELCKLQQPEYREVQPGHFAMCHKLNGTI